MPTDISNALGTARQFTPRPDALYQQRLTGVQALQHAASQFTNHALVAENLNKLTSAMRNFEVNDERRKDEWGLEAATRLINSTSAEDIAKLDVIDAAQQAGYLNVADNPYFKAHAERLRGEFMSTEARRAYDEKYAQLPAESADAEMKRWDEFRTDWVKEKVTTLPLNQVAFDEGFNKNGMVNRTLIGNEYSKKQIEENMQKVIAGTRAQLGMVAQQIPDMLAQNGAITKAFQAPLEGLRLAGVPFAMRLNIAKEALNNIVSKGRLPKERALQMMDKVTIQTDMYGSRQKLSDVIDPFIIGVMADNYQNQFFNETKYNVRNKYKDDPDMKRYFADGKELFGTDEYEAHMSQAGNVYSLQQENIERQKREAMQKSAGAAVTSNYSNLISDCVDSALRFSSVFDNGRRKVPMSLSEFKVETVDAKGNPKMRPLTSEELYVWYLQERSKFSPHDELRVLSLPFFSGINAQIREAAQSALYQITPSLLDNPNQRQRVAEYLNGYAQLYRANPNLFYGVYGEKIGNQISSYLNFCDSTSPDEAIQNMANYMSMQHDSRDVDTQVNKLMKETESVKLTTLQDEDIDVSLDNSDYLTARLHALTIANLQGGASYERAFAKATETLRKTSSVFKFGTLSVVLPTSFIASTGCDKQSVDDCITNIIEEYRDGGDSTNLNIYWDNDRNCLEISSFGSTKVLEITKEKLINDIQWQRDKNSEKVNEKALEARQGSTTIDDHMAASLSMGRGFN